VHYLTALRAAGLAMPGLLTPAADHPATRRQAAMTAATGSDADAAPRAAAPPAEMAPAPVPSSAACSGGRLPRSYAPHGLWHAVVSPPQGLSLSPQQPRDAPHLHLRLTTRLRLQVVARRVVAGLVTVFGSEVCLGGSCCLVSSACCSDSSQSMPAALALMYTRHCLCGMNVCLHLKAALMLDTSCQSLSLLCGRYMLLWVEVTRHG
jgi:hypothetical protein